MSSQSVIYAMSDVDVIAVLHAILWYIGALDLIMAMNDGTLLSLVHIIQKI